MNSAPTKPSQTTALLAHLAKYGSISTAEAQTVYGIYRLSARIHALRKRGYRIESDLKTDPMGKVYARYRFARGKA